jgi:tRNA(Arg) A34 adenosine deaminase TadA
MLLTSLHLKLPPWLDPADLPPVLPDLEDRMRLVLGLAARNVVERTGGPFGAAVAECDSGRLVSVGVNVVVPQHCALAHAEVMALGLAQAARRTFDLGAARMPHMQLVSSSQMCAMCLGAVLWSGVSEVVFATTAEDVIGTIGFDEGPTPPDYEGSLRERGISVRTGVLRDEGLAILRRYVADGAPTYNSHH